MYGTAIGQSTRALTIGLFLSRQDVKLAKLNLRRLHLHNIRSTAPIIAHGGPVVSITTYGSRLQTVYLTLESIAVASVRPSRIVLWLDDADALNNLPNSLRRLERRGLELRLTKNYGPHTKYYPYVLSANNFDRPLVTADDDVLYSRWWLAGLQDAHARDSSVVNCYRAHIIRISGGVVQPYRTWRGCQSTEPSFCHFATGVSGCIYPASFLSSLRLAGSEFLRLCPAADDIWLHVNALRSGFKTKQIRRHALNFAFVPGTQSNGLATRNVGLSFNDDQIKRTYTERDIALLASSV